MPLKASAHFSLAAQKHGGDAPIDGFATTEHSSIPASPLAAQREAPLCRKDHPIYIFSLTGRDQCTDCIYLNDPSHSPHEVIEYLIQCRSIREFVEQAASQGYSSHIATILLTNDARILECDVRAQAFLNSSKVFDESNGHLHCCDALLQPRLLAALKVTAGSGHPSNLLVAAKDHPEQRFSLTLMRMPAKQSKTSADNNSKTPIILCLVAPLDKRRFATARQLMDLFGLTAAEARLARGLCQGDSLEEYAQDQGVCLTTVKTQLRAVLAKTGTERQGALIRLIAAIPVIREVG